MLPGTCRKLKALVILVTLSVSEGRRVSARILLSGLQSDGSASNADSDADKSFYHEHERMEQAIRAFERLRAIAEDQHAKFATENRTFQKTLPTIPKGKTFSLVEVGSEFIPLPVPGRTMAMKSKAARAPPPRFPDYLLTTRGHLQTRSQTARRAAMPLLTATAASSSAGDAGSDRPLRRWLIDNRSLLLLVCLVMHKTATDGLTRYTRMSTDYSGSTVAIMSEIVKFPLIGLAIATLGGGSKEIWPTFKAAITSKPFANAWIALCYTFNNLLYFDALSALSAIAYQVLSQSKTLFTAGLMYLIVGKRLVLRQVMAIIMLIGGAVLVQLQELAKASAQAPSAAAATAATAAASLGTGSLAPAYWGAILVLFSSFISALPNVAYEKVLKTEGANQWVNNIQITVWIMVWVAGASLLPIVRSFMTGHAVSALSSVPMSPSALVTTITNLPTAVIASFGGFTPAVWGVVLLKALNGILIPATFKYADNLLYAYAKPSSIVVMTILSAIAAGALPPSSLVLGVSAVVASIFLYSYQPPPKDQRKKKV